MSDAAAPAGKAAEPQQRLLKLAILAVGGQGGGVLNGWVEAVARANGYAVQATSVAGVAQRTGATIYYVEMAPAGERLPVFSLAPSPSDVDILIAAELMEAGRAVMRGFVTPDRTTLIASTHRALAVSEKMVPGDGIASSEAVEAAARIAAKRLIMADMQALASDAGSVISASLLGALAGSGTLPFERPSFEAAIRASGKGVAASLRAFAAGYAAAVAGGSTAAAAAPDRSPVLAVPPALEPAWRALAARVEALPAAVAEVARPGLAKVVDFQDTAYGADYLDRLEALVEEDDPGAGFTFSREAAKHLANAMAYDDVIRVADLKTRAARAARVRRAMRVTADQVLTVTEYMHPRAEEIVGLLPARVGGRLRASARWMGRIDRLVNRGRRLRSDRLWAFLQLYALGGLRGRRRGTLRHADETAHLERWLGKACEHRRRDYALGVEVLRCRRLIKGYSDTHGRGRSKFDRVLAGIELVDGRPDAADWARRLLDAALQDEEGKALDGALATVRSFASTHPEADRPPLAQSASV